MGKLKIAVLISGTGSNMKAIVEACKAGVIDGEVVVVGSDNSEAKGLEFAKVEGISTFVVDYELTKKIDMSDPANNELLPADFDVEEILRKQCLYSNEYLSVMHRASNARIFFQRRAIAEARLLSELKKYPYDLLALAGFMYILSPFAINRINIGGVHRIMNIHPALLPAFPGEHGYEDTFNYGCKVGGCTVHFVDYGEDTGPIIGQKAYEIYPGDRLDAIKDRGLKKEHELYPECIQMFAVGRLSIGERKGRKIVHIAGCL
ncbi:MAG TPA: phosphoribosylglycinamide formyltransferase [Candidatus Moranbacteria bacterium]|nr:phosphoribosylglycinamide formyltransferase [Candidatus Moranbacteria bacterium]